MSLAEIMRETFKPMPSSDREAVERYIERAMEQLDTAYRELSSAEQLRSIMDAIQRFRRVVAEFQDAINKVQPYATTDTEAAKLAVKLGMIAYAIQLVQQRLAEIQAAITEASPTVPAPQPTPQPTMMAPQPTTPTMAIPMMGGMGAE